MKRAVAPQVPAARPTNDRYFMPFGEDGIVVNIMSFTLPFAHRARGLPKPSPGGLDALERDP